MFDARPDFKTSSIDEETNTLHDAENEIAEKIAAAQRPVIIITKAGAESYAAQSTMIANTFPHVPVTFENEAAQIKFRAAQFCNHTAMKATTVGHFVEAADDRTPNPKPFCSSIRSADCFIVFGTPQAPVQNELDKVDVPVFINKTDAGPTVPRINFAAIVAKQRNMESWAHWNKRVQARPCI